MKYVRIFLSLFACMFCLCACNNQNNADLQKQIEELQKQNEELSNRLETPVPTPTATPVPTNTPTPTSTPTPKPTSTSTPTPTNTPKPTINDVELYFDKTTIKLDSKDDVETVCLYLDFKGYDGEIGFETDVTGSGDADVVTGEWQNESSGVYKILFEFSGLENGTLYVTYIVKGTDIRATLEIIVDLPVPTPTNTPTPTPKIDYGKTLSKYKNNISVEYDRIDDNYAIRPKKLSKDDNTIFTVQLSDDGTVLFGALFMFTADDWVFTEKIKIACDDTTYSFEVDYSMLDTEVMSGGKISESVILAHKPEYSSIISYCVDFEPVVNSIRNSKEVVLRFSGDGYEDFVLSDEEIENIIMMWDIYIALEDDSSNINYLY